MVRVPFLDIRFHDVTVSYENLNLLLVVIALVLLIHVLIVKRSEKRAITFSNYDILKKMVGKDAVVERNLLPLVLRLVALALIVFSISNFAVTFIGYSSTTDFVISMDNSASMLDTDIQPSRLDAAKTAATVLIDRLPETTKMGLVTFGGQAQVRTKLTDEKETLREAVENVSFSREAGTAIGEAVILAASELASAENAQENQSVIVLTDGVNNVGVPLNESIAFANARNVSVYTVGIGNSLNESLDDVDVPEGLNGTVTVSGQDGFNATNMQLLANHTGGEFYRASSEQDLERIYERITLAEEEMTIEPVFYLLSIAAILLILEWALGATKYKTLP